VILINSSTYGIGRDDRPESHIIPLTCMLPLSAAGCTIPHRTSDCDGCNNMKELLSSTRETLLQHRSLHIASLKHVLGNLSLLVSSLLLTHWLSRLMLNVINIILYIECTMH